MRTCENHLGHQQMRLIYVHRQNQSTSFLIIRITRCGIPFVPFVTKASPLPLRSWCLKKVSSTASTTPTFFSLKNLISSDLATESSLQLLGTLCEILLLLDGKFHLSNDLYKKTWKEMGQFAHFKTSNVNARYELQHLSFVILLSSKFSMLVFSCLCFQVKFSSLGLG